SIFLLLPRAHNYSPSTFLTVVTVLPVSVSPGRRPHPYLALARLTTSPLCLARLRLADLLPHQSSSRPSDDLISVSPVSVSLISFLIGLHFARPTTPTTSSLLLLVVRLSPAAAVSLLLPIDDRVSICKIEQAPYSEL
ncbi:hypothetical protein ACLOJK_003806, partial [Asimina triloba]